VAGTVQGNVAVFGGSISLEDTAVVEGDLATIGGSVSRSPGAVVSGQVFAPEE
jgi:cytoskeletal protein CcmA (bactofilin family)